MSRPKRNRRRGDAEPPLDTKAYGLYERKWRNIAGRPNANHARWMKAKIEQEAMEADDRIPIDSDRKYEKQMHMEVLK